MKIIFCGGPRGAGKSTLIKKALTEFPELQAIHINKVLLECERRGITPEQFVKQTGNGKAALIVEGKYAHIPRSVNNPATAADFHLGVEHFPSASCFVFVSAHEKELDQRIQSDIKKTTTKPKRQISGMDCNATQWQSSSPY